LRVDLSGRGLGMFFKPWQAELMRFIWSTRRVDSLAAYEHLQASGLGMSRASCIQFLNLMVEEGFLVYEEGTAKGGWKRYWIPAPEAVDEGGFRRLVADRVMVRIREFLEG
jgi:hypothetical protein